MRMPYRRRDDKIADKYAMYALAILESFYGNVR